MCFHTEIILLCNEQRAWDTICNNTNYVRHTQYTSIPTICDVYIQCFVWCNMPLNQMNAECNTLDSTSDIHILMARYSVFITCNIVKWMSTVSTVSTLFSISVSVSSSLFLCCCCFCFCFCHCLCCCCSSLFLCCVSNWTYLFRSLILFVISLFSAVRRHCTVFIHVFAANDFRRFVLVSIKCGLLSINETKFFSYFFFFLSLAAYKIEYIFLMKMECTGRMAEEP